MDTCTLYLLIKEYYYLNNCELLSKLNTLYKGWSQKEAIVNIIINILNLEGGKIIKYIFKYIKTIKV